MKKSILVVMALSGCAPATTAKEPIFVKSNITLEDQEIAAAKVKCRSLSLAFLQETNNSVEVTQSVGSLSKNNQTISESYAEGLLRGQEAARRKAKLEASQAQFIDCMKAQGYSVQ